MKNLLKNLALGVVAAILVAATGGIGVLQHYCSCSDTEVLSLGLHGNDASMEDEIAGSCCASEVVEVPESCCNPDQSGTEKHLCGDTDDCCTSVYTYLKTDPVQLLESPSRPILGFIVIETEISSRMNECTTARSQPTTDRLNLPPPMFGKELLCALHQLKADPHVC